MVSAQEIEASLQEVDRRNRDLDRLEREQRQIVSQEVPQRRFGAGVTREQQQAVIQRREASRENIQQIAEQRQQLTQSRSQLLEARRLLINREKEVRRLKRKATSDITSFIQRARSQGLEPIFKGQTLVGFEDAQRRQTIPIESVPEIVARSPEQFERFKEVGIVRVEPTPREIALQQSLPFQERFREPITPIPQERRPVLDERGIEQPFGAFGGIITAPEERGVLEQARFEQAVRRQELEQLPEEERDILFQPELFTLGLASSITSQGLFVKNLVTQPITTVASIPGGIVQATQFVKEGGIARELRFGEPLFITGRITGEIIGFKIAQQVLVRGPPIARGLVARIEPGFRPVKLIDITKVPLKIKAVVDVPLEKIQPIGLIPKGKPLVPKIKGVKKGDLPATIKGGFSAKEKRKFLGAIGVVTSQRGLFRLFRRKAKLKETEQLFGTPKDIILQTRVSRLGDLPKPATLKDILAGDISFKGPGQPQIIVFPKEKVGRIGGFEKIGKGTELETFTVPDILGGPKEVLKVGKLGITVIGLRRVVIIEAKFPGPIDLRMAKLDTQLKISTEPISTPVVRPATTLPTKPTQKVSTIKITTPKIVSSKIVPSKITGVSVAVPSFKIKPVSTGPPTPRIPLPPSVKITPRPIPLPPVRTPPRPPAKPPIRPPARFVPRITLPKERMKIIKFEPGFRTFVIKEGKKVFLPGIRPKGKALKLGAVQVTQTLRATFGIEKTKIPVTEKDIRFKPSTKVFRGFRIKKGERVPLKNIFIQRTKEERGLPGGRLQFPREVRAIQNIKAIKIR